MSRQISSLLKTICIIVLLREQLPAQTFWQQLEGPYAGTITALTAQPDIGLLAGSKDGNIYRLANGSVHWNRLSFAGGIVSSIASGPGPIVYAASASGPVWSSRDSGGTWSLKNTGLAGKNISHIAVNGNGGLFAAADDGIYRSTDQGDHWVQVNNGLTSPRVMHIAISSTGGLYAATFRGGVFRSYDQGNSWVAINAGLHYGSTRSIVVDRQNSLFVGTVNGGIFLSDDDGNSWTKCYSGGTWLQLDLDPAGNLVAVDDNGFVIRSTNSGRSWSNLSTDNLSYIVSTFTFNGAGTFYAGTNGQGIIRAENQLTSWVGIGLNTANVHTILCLPDGSLLATTENGLPGGGACFLSTDQGDTWRPSSLLNQTVRQVILTSEGKLFGATADAIYQSTDGARSWSQLSFGSPPGVLTSIAVATGGELLVGTASRGAFIFSPGLGTWSPLGLDTLAVNAVGTDVHGNRFAATNIGLFADSAARDSAGWKLASISGDRQTTLALAVEGDTVSVGGHGFIGHSSDNGLHWERFRLPDSGSDVVTFSAMRWPRIFAGTTHGTLESGDGGRTWVRVSGDLDSLTIRSLAFTANGRLFAGTPSDGIFRTSGIISAVSRGESTHPTKMALIENYPNPFNPSTTIRYTVPRSGEIDLEIFNLTGKRVGTLASGFRAQGEYSTTWSASTLPSGVYWCRLVGNGFTAVHTLVFVK